MECAALLSILCACSDGQDRVEVDPADYVLASKAPWGVVSAELSSRGFLAYPTSARTYLLPPDEGENCVTSWVVGPLAAAVGPYSELTGHEVPVPTDPAAVSSWAMPSADPSGAFIPPVFVIDGESFAWSGGTWEVVEWSERRLEIAMVGETCEFGGWPDSCVPDEGALVVEVVDEEAPPLVVEEVGYLGAGERYPDPRGTGVLCDRITHVPLNNSDPGDSG